MPSWLYALIVVMLEAWSTRRDAKMRLLKLQVEILRSRLSSNRVILSPDERTRMIAIAEAAGGDVADALVLVTPQTYKRWLKARAEGVQPGKVGRPAIEAQTRELIVRLARENPIWGLGRIVGELKKLGVSVGESTVRRVLIAEGLFPDPDRSRHRQPPSLWLKFIRLHMSTLVACDFFAQEVLTPLGKRIAYSLVFMHLESRRVFVSPATYHPDDAWMRQQGRNVMMWMEDERIEPRFLIRDRDGKFPQSFDALFQSQGMKVLRTPIMQPNANAFVESWIGHMRYECLDHLMCFSLKHLDHIIQTYARFHNRYRPHQSLGNRPLNAASKTSPRDGPVRRLELLGGLLSHYYRDAA